MNLAKTCVFNIICVFIAKFTSILKNNFEKKPLFLVGGGGGGKDFKKKFLGPMGLPSNSQKAPQDVWNNASNLSHMVCPKFNSHVYKLKRWAIRERACLQRGSRVGGCPMFQKNR
jgi:hypothetical protein